MPTLQPQTIDELELISTSRNLTDEEHDLWNRLRREEQDNTVKQALSVLSDTGIPRNLTVRIDTEGRLFVWCYGDYPAFVIEGDKLTAHTKRAGKWLDSLQKLAKREGLRFEVKDKIKRFTRGDFILSWVWKHPPEIDDTELISSSVPMALLEERPTNIMEGINSFYNLTFNSEVPF